MLIVVNILILGDYCITCSFIRQNFEQLLQDIYYYFYTYGSFLVLILFGAWIARRHGRLAVLLPLGYLLPTLIYGRVSNEWPSPDAPEFSLMLSVSTAALIYRFLVSLAGPLWIVRSATGQMQKRASVISIVILIAIQAAFHLGLLFSGRWGGNQLANIYFAIAEQLIIGTGIALALVLYRKDLPAKEAQIKELISDSASIS